MDAPLETATICRKAWWLQQRGGVWAVPAGACACLGFGCAGTIACANEAAARDAVASEPPAPSDGARRPIV